MPKGEAFIYIRGDVILREQEKANGEADSP